MLVYMNVVYTATELATYVGDCGVCGSIQCILLYVAYNVYMNYNVYYTAT